MFFGRKFTLRKRFLDRTYFTGDNIQCIFFAQCCYKQKLWVPESRLTICYYQWFGSYFQVPCRHVIHPISTLFFSSFITFFCFFFSSIHHISKFFLSLYSPHLQVFSFPLFTTSPSFFFPSIHHISKCILKLTHSSQWISVREQKTFDHILIIVVLQLFFPPLTSVFFKFYYSFVPPFSSLSFTLTLSFYPSVFPPTYSSVFIFLHFLLSFVLPLSW